ncbi:hypothetical protein GGS23DRAFT_561369 [Durotheca rogersii]|uniref:uncharacterized protein n=1 Tax=Durotheca rogersii TaxID=419775 RepID=UPI00221EFD0C|nr:uncharacterized protein GGS23DRAFT_561369 [Durotheca rogersii]KAI5864677.1 hypothetical protein GGS23DRAFT_561369 [Durotheca rogersii]
MYYQTLAALLVGCSSLLASVTASPLSAPISDEIAPRRLQPPHRRSLTAAPQKPRAAPVLSGPAPKPRSKRHVNSYIKRDANTTFDLAFDASGVPLFDGAWPVLGQTFSLSLDCAECRTFGQLVVSADFPDDFDDLLGGLKDLNPFNDINLSVGFEGVGAILRLGVTAASDGFFTIPLFASQTPVGISGPGFTIGVTFGVDLIIGVSAAVTTEGGFEVAIPDGSLFSMPLDTSLDNIGNFEGATTTLLPLTVDAPAELSVTLRLKVQAGLDLPSNPFFDATALAGAFMNIPEVTLSEQFSTVPDETNCLLPASAAININAGAFVNIGADIANIDLFSFNPTVSTTFFSATATTCFVSAGEDPATEIDELPEPTGTGGLLTGTAGYAAAAAATGCPVELTTETNTATSTFTITSCAAAVANCPDSLTQVIVVTEPVTATTTRCPVKVTGAPFANATAHNPAPGSPITLTSLTAPVTGTLSIDPSVVKPDAPSVTGSARSAATSTSTTTATTSVTSAAPAVSADAAEPPFLVTVTTVFVTRRALDPAATTVYETVTADGTTLWKTVTETVAPPAP